MEPKTNYALVGVAVLLLFTGFLFTGLWLSVGFNQKSYNTYLVYMHEAVTGLSESSPVKFNGVKVGVVDKITLNYHDPQQIKLRLSIEKGTPITTSTYATLLSQGITGITVVGLSATSSSLTPLQKTKNHPYPIIPAKPSLLKQIDKVLQEVSTNINSVSLQMKQIFGKENAIHLKATLANIDKFTRVLAENNQNISTSLDNMNKFLINITKASHEFPYLVSTLQTGVDKWTNIASFSKIMLNNISQQTVPAATMLLQHLNSTATNLEQISNQMRQNPAVLIRGTTAAKPGPGE